MFYNIIRSFGVIFAVLKRKQKVFRNNQFSKREDIKKM